MCGIIGYVGKDDCVDFLVRGLQRLEYRGYDSAGVACLNGSGKYQIVKSEGKLEEVKKLLKSKPIKGHIGLGHTRWATHGKPNTTNAHPHRAGTTVLVHNGIIENYQQIRDELQSKGYSFVSETDTELFAHLVEEQKKQGLEFAEAARTAFLKLEGGCSIVVVDEQNPETLIGIRNGTPLVAAFSKKSSGAFIASDAQALLDHTEEVTFLENMEMVLCTPKGFSIFPADKKVGSSKPIQRKPVHCEWTPEMIDKGGFEHYMLKEIHEQPKAVLDTLDSFVDRKSGKIRFENQALSAIRKSIQKAKKIQITACGTAWHAGLIAKYVIEGTTRVPVEVDLASEYRYRDPIVGKDTLMIAISQSGETADTLSAFREAKSKGAMTAAICNAKGSSLTREADATVFTVAGPEIGVASTKAFTTQVLALILLASLKDGDLKSLKISEDSLSTLPHRIQTLLGQDNDIRAIAEACKKQQGFLFIGRGLMYPIALEGALKMKEITYIHAEGYPAGELKHGPIALVEPSMTLVIFAPRDKLFDKTLSNLQEVKARGGKIISIGNRDDEQLKKLSDHYIGCDFNADWTDALIAAIPAQLLSYYMAVLKGTDVDKPRNLAKSVTVE